MLQQQGLSYEEIAQALDASLSAVKTWIHRARTHLRERTKRLSPERARTHTTILQNNRISIESAMKTTDPRDPLDNKIDELLARQPARKTVGRLSHADTRTIEDAETKSCNDEKPAPTRTNPIHPPR